jgi:hypothetical protein
MSGVTIKPKSCDNKPRNSKSRWQRSDTKLFFVSRLFGDNRILLKTNLAFVFLRFSSCAPLRQESATQYGGWRIEANPRPSALISIRKAKKSEAPRLAELLSELGYPASSHETRTRQEQLSHSSKDFVRVAEIDKQVVGLAALHIMPLLHLDRPMGRITALVVGSKWQCRGVGKVIV